MQYIILILFGSCLSLGIYLIFAYFGKIPSLKATKAIINFGKKKRKQSKDSDAIIFDLAVKVSKYIHVNSYKKRNLTAILRSAEINMSPEVYLAQAYIKTAFVALFIPITLLIFPLISPAFLIGAIAIYFSETKKAEKIIEGRKKEIEDELPRFVATLAQSLKSSRDIQNILEAYSKNAGPALKNELNITTADMSTGNYNEALTRLETRLPIAHISQISHGLRGVLDGNNNADYFQNLSTALKEIELSKLKKIAYQRPPKIRKCSFMLLAGMIIMYMGVMGYQIITTMGDMY